MWFRRKKKPDPDSTLTETLRSLQTLLENENSSNLSVESKVDRSEEVQSGTSTEAPPDRDQAAAEGSASEGRSADEDNAPANMQAAVETHQQHPLQVSGEEPAGGQTGATGPDEATTSEHGEAQETEEQTDFWADFPIPEKTEENLPWVDPFQSDEGPSPPEELIVELQREDLSQDDIVIPTIDTIPVLTNVVYVPPQAEAAAVASAPPMDLTQIIDATVRDLQERLEQHDLDKMDGEQETTLRQALTRILTAANSDDPD